MRNRERGRTPYGGPPQARRVQAIHTSEAVMGRAPSAPGTVWHCASVGWANPRASPPRWVVHRQGTDAQQGDAAAKPDSGHKATALHCTYRPHMAHLSGTRCLRVHPRNRPERTRGEIQIQGCEIPDAGLWAHM